MQISEIASFVPSEKNTRVFKINLDTPLSTGQDVVTIQKLQEPKIKDPISENDDYYPEKKNKNSLRKKKKNAILNMPGGVTTTDALRHNGIYTKPLHKKLTPSQKKLMLRDREMNENYYDEYYTGLPAPVGGFKVGSSRHPKKFPSPLPSQEEQFKQRTSQFANKNNIYRVGSNNNNNNWNNTTLNSFIENNSTPKDNENSDESLPFNRFNEVSKMDDTNSGYTYSNNKNNTRKVEHPDRKSYRQCQAPSTERYSNERKLQKQQLNQAFGLKDSCRSNEFKSTETHYSHNSNNLNTYNPAGSTDLNAVVSLIQMAINTDDKKKRKKNLSAMDIFALIQAAIKNNEDMESDLESDADISEGKKKSKKSKKKKVVNRKKIERSKKKKYHSNNDTETETETSDTDSEYDRKKKRKIKKEKTKRKVIKNRDYYTVSDSGSDSNSDSDSDFEYNGRYARYKNRMKMDLLKYQPDLDLEYKRDRQRGRHKKEKKKMQKLMLKYESEDGSDSNSGSDYLYKEVNGFKRKMRNPVTSTAAEKNEVKIRRKGSRKKASKKKSFSNGDYSDNEYLTKNERLRREALKEMEESYNQMKREFMKMKMTVEGSKNKKSLNNITVEEPEGVMSECDSKRYKPKLLTYNNRSLRDSDDDKKKSKLKSRLMDSSDESFSNYKEKKVKAKSKNILSEVHKSNSESESDSDSDSDYYKFKSRKAKTENKPNPVDSFDELYSDFEDKKDKKKRTSKKHKKVPLKIRSDFSVSDSKSDSNSQFDDNINNHDKIRSKNKVKNKPHSLNSGFESFTEYEEKKKLRAKEKKKKYVDPDSDSDSDSGSDFYELKDSSKAKSKPNPMDSADESFSDYEEKKSKKPKKVDRRKK